MGFRSNRAYLNDELNRLIQREGYVNSYLKNNPSIALQKRVIKGKSYFYIRYKKDGKSFAEYFTKDPSEAKEKRIEVEKMKALRRKLKEERKVLMNDISLLKAQIKIVDKAIHSHA